MCNIFRPKINVLKVFSETAHELMVMRKPNAHPWPHLIQQVPTVLINLPRRKSRFPFEILMLFCNTVTVKQMICWVYKWSLAQELSKSFHLISLGAVSPEKPHSENLLFCARRFGTYYIPINFAVLLKILNDVFISCYYTNLRYRVLKESF